VQATSNLATENLTTRAASHDSALGGLRIIDMSGLAGQYCGKMFADLGADVILVEPPGGSPTRRDGPFLSAQAHHEMSLTFSYFNSGKRSIVLNLDTAGGQMLLRKLVSKSDLLIESERPGVMAARRLNYDSLVSEFSNIVMTSITPFGQTGPYAHYEAEDITLLALGGLLSLGGYYCAPAVPAVWNGGMETVTNIPSWKEVFERYPPNRDILLAQDPKEFIAVMERWMEAYCSCGGELIPGLPDDDARGLDIPALVFRSGASDYNHPRETSEQVAALLPNAQLVEPPWPDTEWIDRARGIWQGFERWPLLAPQLLEWAQTALR